MGKRNYFSWDKEEKYCPNCKVNVKLNKFRVVKQDREYDEASRYCSICRACENDRSKEYQRTHYKHKLSQGARE